MRHKKWMSSKCYQLLLVTSTMIFILFMVTADRPPGSSHHDGWLLGSNDNKRFSVNVDSETVTDNLERNQTFLYKSPIMTFSSPSTSQLQPANSMNSANSDGTDNANPLHIKHESLPLPRPADTQLQGVNDQLEKQHLNHLVLTQLQKAFELDSSQQNLIDPGTTKKDDSVPGESYHREPQRSNIDVSGSSISTAEVYDEQKEAKENHGGNSEHGGIAILAAKAGVVCLAIGIFIVGCRKVLMTMVEPNDYKTAWRNAYSNNNQNSSIRSSVLPVVMGRSTRDIEYQPL